MKEFLVVAYINVDAEDAEGAEEAVREELESSGVSVLDVRASGTTIIYKLGHQSDQKETE